MFNGDRKIRYSSFIINTHKKEHVNFTFLIALIKNRIDFDSRRNVYWLATACFLVNIILIYFSKGTYDAGDGVQHYLIAKHALQHPLLLLDHWGKPIYTLLCMPFAQFGFFGSNVFNLMCNTATALIAYHISIHLGLKNSWLAFIFVFFSPLFYITSFSGLTEPSFALILCTSILLMFRAKYYAAAALISLLPFARTEGFFIVPVFILFLMIQQQWKPIVLCGLATLVYAVIGWLVLGDFLWIIHQNPYKGAFDIYGKGPLFHFVAANDRLFGLPLVVLFLIGCVALLIQNNLHEKAPKASYMLILGSFSIYFILHSVFWWKGLFGSLGLHRVMAAVAPLFSLIALCGYNFFEEKIVAYPRTKKVISGIIIAAVVVYPFKQYRPPLKPDTEMEVLLQTSAWIKENNIDTKNKVYCMYPLMGMLLDVDVFNPNKYISTCMLKLNDFNKELKQGDIIIWDSHFGHECGFDTKTISQLKGVSLLKQFRQETQHHQAFEVAVFTVR